MGKAHAQRRGQQSGRGQNAHRRQIDETRRTFRQTALIPACPGITQRTRRRNRPAQSGRSADGAVNRHIAESQIRHGQRTAADTDPARQQAEQPAHTEQPAPAGQLPLGRRLDAQQRTHGEDGDKQREKNLQTLVRQILRHHRARRHTAQHPGHHRAQHIHIHRLPLILRPRAGKRREHHHGKRRADGDMLGVLKVFRTLHLQNPQHQRYQNRAAADAKHPRNHTGRRPDRQHGGHHFKRPHILPLRLILFSKSKKAIRLGRSPAGA